MKRKELPVRSPEQVAVLTDSGKPLGAVNQMDASVGEVQVQSIFGGTTEIMKESISRGLGL